MAIPLEFKEVKSLEIPKHKKVKYERLTPKQRRIYNFRRLATKLSGRNFDCTHIHDGCKSAEFRADRKDGEQTILKVRFEVSIAINKKYRRKSIYLTFPVNKAGKTRYFVEHDTLVGLVAQETTWLSTKSWKQGGCYRSGTTPKKLLDRLADYAWLY